MGLLRLLLALAVLLGHAHGLGGYSMIGGPLAVQCFFIISGFYMGLVLNERYDSPALNRTFWINRAIRIYAVYFLFLALHLGLFALLQVKAGASPLSPYFDVPLPLGEKMALAMLNLTVVGQDLPLWLTVEDQRLVWTSHFVASGEGAVFRFMAIPAAWSLSLELCFYALAPFIVRRPAGQIAAIVAASLFVRALVAGWGLDADPFSYRFFPFELALFLAGALGYKAWAARRDWWERPIARALALSVPLCILAWPWLIGTWPYDAFFTPPRLFLLSLLACGLPAIHAWSRRSALDRTIGELSYPFYLGHLLVLGVVASVPAMQGRPALTTLSAIGATLLVSWLVVRAVEPPIEAFRRGLAARAGARA